MAESNINSNQSEQIGAAGFSLLDMLAAMVIISIVASSSIAFFSDLGPSFDRWNARSALLRDLRFAQSSAIEEGCRMIMKISVDGNQYSFGCDYLDYDYSAPYDYDREFVNSTLPRGVSLTTAATLFFNAKGQSVTADGEIADLQISLHFTDEQGTSNYFGGTVLATGVFASN
jgi:Tfp pilus assembly protein FimT